MGYQPTMEELRFVYELILDGATNREILDEYARLLEIGQLVFPLRSDVRFIKARRRELETSSGVLQEHVRRTVDPIIVKARQEHFEYLAGISNTLLSGGLHDLTVIYTPEDTDCKHPLYAVLQHQPSVEPVESWTQDELSRRLKENLALAHDRFGESQVNSYYLSHLKAEIPDFKNLNTVIDDAPISYIETLKVLSNRRTFKGTCPVCQDW
jgi:hypothetical protein